MKKSIWVSLAGLLILGNSGNALAEKAEWRSWPLGQRLNVGVGAYRPSIDTEVNLTAGEIRGRINLEQNFGLEDTKTVPLAGLRWRFFKRHTFRIDYFELDRSGAGTAPADLQLCPDNVCLPNLPVEWPVNSFIDAQVLNFGYDYSIIFNEKMNWSIGLGLSAQDFSMGVVTENPVPDEPTIEAQSEFIAPLPSLATTYSYAFSDKWILDLALNWLEVDIDIDSGKFDGRIWSYSAAIRWQTFKNIGFGLGYTGFDIDIDVDDGDEIGGSFDYRYRGPHLNVNFYF